MYQTYLPTNLDTERGTRCVAKKVSAKMNSTLVAKFTKEEVEMALKRMAPLKSADPNGFNPISTKLIGILWEMR